MTAISDRPVRPKPYLMQNQIQHYEWGTRDKDAFIPRLMGIAPQPGVPYGELWMGAHPKAPSAVFVDDQPVALDRWIAEHPQELLGKSVSSRFDRKLPFLLKVLSAGEALSIQAHPNKAQARQLHAEAPEHYPDDNHKPEVAIALDSLTALMGIRPVADLATTLSQYPEIAEFVGADVASRVQAAYALSPQKQRDTAKLLFTTLITRSVSQPDALSQTIAKLSHRLGSRKREPTEVETLFLTLQQKYPGADVGLLCVFLMNLVRLSAGEAMFAEAGVPHAYLKGNIIECMANSDNVVRVGLTLKYKDARSLLEILRYEPGPVKILGGTSVGGTVVYKTPAPEFRVSRFDVAAGANRHVSTAGRPCIMVVTAGEIVLRYAGGHEVCRRGQSVFVPAILPEYSIFSAQPSVVFKAEIPVR